MKICLTALLAAPSIARGLDVIRKEARPVYRTSSGVRLCWELEEPKGPEGLKNPKAPATIRAP